MSGPEYIHQLFEPAGEDSRRALAQLALHTIAEAERRGLTVQRGPGPGIDLDDEHLCVHSTRPSESIGLMAGIMLSSVNMLRVAVRRDTERFPDAEGRVEAKSMLTRAAMRPHAVLPVYRREFVYVNAQPPHQEFNAGVAYTATDSEHIVVLDSTDRTADTFALTNFAVEGWMDRLREFRVDHNFPPAETSQ